MKLKLYNSKTNLKEEFNPIDPNHVKIYACGPTVYNEIHIGNARSAITFDLLFRILQLLYPKVTYVRNITDIDDKIINKANNEKKTCEEVAEYWNKSYKNNCILLNLLEPTYTPKATETVKEIIDFVSNLIENGFAYEYDGSVFFKVSELDSYGELSNNYELMNAKRISENNSKQDQRDFVLWKPSKINEPYWNSPWGKGRPGWHIECSAMSLKFLGEQFDIHAGGSDLLFPHHENENAQNIGLNGKYAGPKYWIHNAMLLMCGEKMSKSLGNIILLSQAYEKYNPIFLKFYILNTHYRHLLNFEENSIEQLAIKFDNWILHLGEYFKYSDQILKEDIEDLLNDLNTPGFFVNFELKLSEALSHNNEKMFIKLANILTFLGLNVEIKEPTDMVINLANERLKLKMDKKYKEADELRQEIEALGYCIMDTNENYNIKYKFSSILK